MTTLTYLSTNAQHYYPAVLAFLVSGGGITVLTNVRKRVKEFQKDTAVQRFVLLLSFLGASADWYLQNYSTHFAHAVTPFVWFPAVTTALFTIATFWHHIPFNKVAALFPSNPFKGYSQLKTDAAAYRAEVEAQKAAPRDSTFI